MSDDNGFEDLSKQLGKLADVGEVAKEGLSAGAKIYAEKLRASAPYDSHHNSPYGHLRDQIRVEQDGDNIQVTSGDAFWHRFVEHGRGGKHPMRATNFERSTWDQVESQVINAMTKKITE